MMITNDNSSPGDHQVSVVPATPVEGDANVKDEPERSELMHISYANMCMSLMHPSYTSFFC